MQKNKVLNFKAFFKFLLKSHCEKELRSEENSLKTSYYSSFLVVREIINKFLLKHPNIFKKFFIHEFFGKTQLLTNEDIDSKDGFYLIFFIEHLL